MVLFYSANSLLRASLPDSSTNPYRNSSVDDVSQRIQKNQFEIRKDFDNGRRKIEEARQRKLDLKRERNAERTLRPEG